MSILDNNLKLLSKKNKTLALKILNHTEFSSKFILDEAVSGDYILKKNDIPLSSNIDPEQEAIDLLNKIEHKDSNSFNFIYGLGLGYLLKRFNKSIQGYILVYEPDLDVLRLVFEMVDFSDELKNDRVIIFNDYSYLKDFYKENFFYDYQISTSICETYKKHDLANAQNFIKELGYIHGLYLSNYDVYWRKYQRWTNAFMNNINEVAKYDEVKILKDKFKNKPALIISAGPSLNKNIDLIAKYQDNFIIFCVGTALKSVLAKGITPDFVCVIESLQVTAKMIDDSPDYNIILQPATHNDIFKKNSKHKFLFYADNDEVCKFLANKFSISTKEYINRGTVSINALVSAKLMGCNPIVLVGQDLAYTNNECYAKGSIYDTYKVEDNKVITTNYNELLEKTAESKAIIDHRLSTLTKQLYKVKGQNGEMLYSPGDYASFIKYFEDLAVDYGKHIKLINATEGGAQIDGYENMTLQEVINKFSNQKLDKNLNYKKNITNKNEQILKNEIKKCFDAWNSFIKNNFENGNKIASHMEIDYKNKNNFSLFENEFKNLLVLYKNLHLHINSDLFKMIAGRNILFIDQYLKNFKYNKDKNNLINNLHLLYKTDYETYIKPNIDKLEIYINTGV